MDAAFVFGLVAAVSAAFGLLMLRRLRYDVLPALGFSLAPAAIAWPLAFFAGQALVTCNADDCGHLEFVALLIFSTLVSLSATAGATVAILIYAWCRRRD